MMLGLDRRRGKVYIILFMLGFLCYLVLKEPSGWDNTTTDESPQHQFTPLKNQRPMVPLDFGATYGRNHSGAVSEAYSQVARVGSDTPHVLMHHTSDQGQDPTTIEDQYESKTTNQKEPNSCQKGSIKLSLSQKREVNSGSFQSAGNSTSVYSAYFDAPMSADKDGHFVKVVGLSAFTNSFVCHVWHKGSKKSKRELEMVNATIIPRKFYDKYAVYESALVQCEVSPRPGGVFPRWVVLSDLQCGPPRAVLPVYDPLSVIIEDIQVTVCLLTPITQQVTVQHFVEWVETHRLFGVQHFVLYVSSMEGPLGSYVEHYVEEGVVEVRGWPTDTILEEGLVNETKGSLVDDCLYRKMHQTKYLIFVELSEYLVPYRYGTLYKTIQNSPCTNSDIVLVKSLSFISPKVSVSNSSLITQTYFGRKNFAWPYDMHRHLVVRPERVISKKASRTESCHLPTALGKLHHYPIEGSGPTVWDMDLKVLTQRYVMTYNPGWENIVTDRRMAGFAREIQTRVSGMAQAMSLPRKYEIEST